MGFKLHYVLTALSILLLLLIYVQLSNLVVIRGGQSAYNLIPAGALVVPGSSSTTVTNTAVNLTNASITPMSHQSTYNAATVKHPPVLYILVMAVVIIIVLYINLRRLTLRGDIINSAWVSLAIYVVNAVLALYILYLSLIITTLSIYILLSLPIVSLALYRIFLIMRVVVRNVMRLRKALGEGNG